MKLATTLSLIGLGLGATAFVVSQGCSSDSSSGTTVADTKRPPEPEGPPTTASDERTFALNALHLGEATRDGRKDKEAWREFGYDLDGLDTKVTDQKSPDLGKVCKRAAGAPATVHQDGTKGTDNAFGKEILKLLDPFTPTPSKSITDSIIKGDFTIMLRIKGLTDDPAQTNTNLSGKLLVGGEFGDGKTPPTFTTADDWPFRQDPQVDINDAYINKGTFVNGKGGATIQLALSIQGQTLSLTISKAIITFEHKPATKEVVNGTIAGIINTEEFVTGIGSVAGRFSKDLCQGSTVEGIKQSIRQASDILTDGTQDPGKECNGISVGIGFSGKQVANPTKTAPESAPPPDPCTEQPDAGTDSGTDAGTDASDAATD